MSKENTSETLPETIEEKNDTEKKNDLKNDGEKKNDVERKESESTSTMSRGE